MELTENKEYLIWISELKKKVRSAQIKAAVAVNRELILFYWDLGMMLSEKIKSSNWGDKILANVSKEMKLEFPLMTGLSERNLKYCRRFYEFYSNLIGQQLVAQLSSETDIITNRQQLVAQIPWGQSPYFFKK